MLGVALAAVVVAASGEAPGATELLDAGDAGVERSDAPRAQSLEPDAGLPDLPPVLISPRRRNYWLPLVEGFAFDLLLLGFGLATDASYSQISVSTWAANLRGPWVFDTDEIYINQLGHPYQGAMAYTAARAAGLPVWLAWLYPLFHSTVWELFGESTPPSVNDEVTTVVGGSVLGEVLHRLSYSVLASGDWPPSTARRVAAYLLAPFGGLNRDFFGPFDTSDLGQPPHLALRLNLGLSALQQVADQTSADPTFRRIPAALMAGLHLSYGLSGDGSWTYPQPFSHFDLDFTATVGAQLPFVSLFIRGLLVGDGFSWGPRHHGLRGVFASYDMSARAVFKVSTSAFGLGTTNQFQLSDRVYLNGTALVSLVPLGAAGLLVVPLADGRDYHFGPGAQGLLELSLSVLQRLEVRAAVRQYVIVGSTQEVGTELVTLGSAAATVDLFGPHGVSLEAQLSRRAGKYPGTPLSEQLGVLVRLSYVLLLDRNFAVVRQERAP